MKIATVTSNDTTPVRVTYEPLPYSTTTGTISVTTTPVAAKIYINNEYAGTGSIIKKYPPGTYTVRFDAVEGYITPDSKTVVITVGETNSFVGLYEPIEPTPEPTPPPPAIAPIIQLYSTRTTITSKQPGLLSISAVNPMKNPVLTAQTIFTVDPGVEVMGVGTPFVSSGAGQYIGKFIVLPDEEKHYTVSVRALRDDLTAFTVKAQTYYYYRLLDSGCGNPVYSCSIGIQSFFF
ncbi:MAG: PEGA domain-containing protein, partial [Halobacteriota archaeon]